MSLDALRAALVTHEPVEIPALPGRANHLRAGVLVPVVWGQRPEVLAIVRPSTMRLHAGEVSFPGGRREPGDRDLVHTALRETEEELGLTDAEVLGQLSAMPLYTSDYRLVPTVALVEGEVTPSPAEVAEVLRYDLFDVLDRDFVEAVPWTHDGEQHLSPIFPLGDHVMYGGTAYVFWELLQVVGRALGRPVPTPRAGERTWAELLG